MTETLYGKRKKELKYAFVFGVVFSVLLSFILFVVVANGFFLIRIEVNQTSMYPTLKDKDIVYANRFKSPDYGDIIIISDEESDWIVKRVVGMGGDTVKISGGYVYLKKSGDTEFIKLPEEYLTQQGITTSTKAIYEIGENEIFYLGDNRRYSKDSRSEFGNCNESQVVGVVTEWSVTFKGLNTAVYRFMVKVSEGINALFGA